MIEVENLRKVYGDFTAVEGSSFSVPDGEVFGVVGPNGAGKTTTLKMLAGLVEPTSGTARVAGYDAENPEMRKHLGFLPEESPPNAVAKLAIGSPTLLTHAMVGVYLVVSLAGVFALRRAVGQRGLGA